MKMLDSVPFTARVRKDITCLRGHIVKLSTQTIHTVCCETPLFSKGKNLNYLIVCFTQCTKVCFLLPICLPSLSEGRI